MVAAFLQAAAPMITAAAPAVISAFGTAGAKSLGDRAGKEAGNALFNNASAGNNAANTPQQVPSSEAQQRMIAMAQQNQPVKNDRTLLGTVGDVIQNVVTAPPKLALGLVGNTISSIGGLASGVGNFLAGR